MTSSVIFTETWSTDSLTIPGFKLTSIQAKKYRAMMYGSSLVVSLLVLIKTELQQGITIISSSTDYI